MSGLTEEAIRNRAYELWQSAGEPYGTMDKFWYQAEKQLLTEGQGKGEKCKESWRGTPLGGAK